MNDRETADILYEEAKKLGLKPVWVTDYGLFSIMTNTKKRFVFFGITYLNSQMGSYLCRNKHSTRRVLDLYRLPNIPYALPQSDDEALAFLSEHKQIIVKPTLGTNSENVSLITNPDELKTIDRETSIFEKYIAGREMRYLVLQDEVIAVHERLFPGPINDPRVVKRVSYTRDRWDSTLIDISLQASLALGVKFAAVDFKIDKDGNAFILEINASPGIKWFHHPTEGPAVNVAKLFLEATLSKLENE